MGDRYSENIQREDTKLFLIDRLEKNNNSSKGNSAAIFLPILFKYETDMKCVGFVNKVKGELFLYLEARRSGLFLRSNFSKSSVTMLSL